MPVAGSEVAAALLPAVIATAIGEARAQRCRASLHTNKARRAMDKTKKHKPGDVRAGLRVHPDAIAPPAQASEQAAPTEPDEPLERAVVATGHVVHINSGRRVQRGSDPNDFSKPIFRTPFVEATPGTEVELPRSEVKRLRETGHLVDPNKVATDEEARTISALPRDAVPPGPVKGNGGGH
jgi:hypothetical protein